jgi:hypothetical protein
MKPMPHDLYQGIFEFALWLEARAICIRDWAQCRKMACVHGEDAEGAW